MNILEATQFCEKLLIEAFSTKKSLSDRRKNIVLNSLKASIDLFSEHPQLLSEEVFMYLVKLAVSKVQRNQVLDNGEARTLITLNSLIPHLKNASLLYAIYLCIGHHKSLDDFSQKISEIPNKPCITFNDFKLLTNAYIWGEPGEGQRYPSEPFVAPKNQAAFDAVLAHMHNSSAPRDYFLTNFPIESLWRFFIDADRESLNPLMFDETEPGYMVACMRAFFNAVSNIERAPSIDFIRQIHKDATQDVAMQSLQDATIKSFSVTNQPGEFRRETIVGFGFSMDTSSHGLMELWSMQAELNYSLFKKKSYEPNRYRIKCWPLNSHDYLFKKVTSIFQDYESLRELYIQNSNAGSPEQHLKNIVLTIQKLERLHPFADGNCRTFCMILLNRELMRTGFPPCLLTNPNHFDGLSQNEMIEEVIAGQNRYLALCNGATTLQYGNYPLCHGFNVACTPHPQALDLVAKAAQSCSEGVFKQRLLQNISNQMEKGEQKKIFKPETTYTFPH